MKTLGNINLLGIGELQNANIQNLATAPTSGLKAGRIYFNTTSKKLFIYDGSAWVDATNQGVIYSEGTGIDISNNTISADFTAVATAAQGALADSALQAGDDISELNNDAGYITGISSSDVTTALGFTPYNATNPDGFISGITSSDVTTALGYTPYNSTNPSGYQANVIEGVTVNGDAVTPANKIVALSIPVDASDVNALPDSTKYAAALDLSINSSTYVITGQLKDQDGNNIGTAQTIDLPLESVVVSGSYDSTNKKIVLTLQSGSTIDIPVGDLVAGLQSEITAQNMLNADLVDDSTAAHKFVSASEKSTWNGKQDAISDLATIRSGAAKGATATQKITAQNGALTVSGGQVEWSISNTLATADVVVSVYEVASGEQVFCDIAASSSAVVITLNASANVAAGTYKAVIIG